MSGLLADLILLDGISSIRVSNNYLNHPNKKNITGVNE